MLVKTLKPFIKVTLMIVVLVAVGRLSWASDADKSREKLIYIMPENKGWQLVEQCTRSIYYPDVFWRVTESQVEAIEKRLVKHIEKLRQRNIGFVPKM